MSYNVWVYYDTNTGRLIKKFRGADDLVADNAPEGTMSVGGDYSLATDYFDVSAESVVPRPDMPVEQSGYTLTVPAGTEYRVQGPAVAEGVTDEGELEFDFAEPGEYRVRLRKFPYLDAEVVLNVD